MSSPNTAATSTDSISNFTTSDPAARTIACQDGSLTHIREKGKGYDAFSKGATVFTSQYHDIVKGLIDTVFETEEEKIRQAGR